MALLSQSMRDDFPLLYELMKPLPKERWVVVLLWLSVSTAARLILSTQVPHSLTSRVLTDSFLIAVQVLSISWLYCFHHWPWLHLHVHIGSQLSPFFFFNKGGTWGVLTVTFTIFSFGLYTVRKRKPRCFSHPFFCLIYLPDQRPMQRMLFRIPSCNSSFK